MICCDTWTIAVAPFPFVDTALAKPRSCLVLSRQQFNSEHNHTLCAMITRPVGTIWPSDLPITDLVLAGLPAPSVIRWKLFTLPNNVLKRVIGTLGPEDRIAASDALSAILE